MDFIERLGYPFTHIRCPIATPKLLCVMLTYRGEIRIDWGILISLSLKTPSTDHQRVITIWPPYRSPFDHLEWISHSRRLYHFSTVKDLPVRLLFRKDKQ